MYELPYSSSFVFSWLIAYDGWKSNLWELVDITTQTPSLRGLRFGLFGLLALSRMDGVTKKKINSKTEAKNYVPRL